MNRVVALSTAGRLLVLMAAVALPFVLIGAVAGGTAGALLGASAGVGLWTASYAVAGRAIVRIFHAELVDRTSHPELVATVDDLSRRAGITAPKVAISHLGTPNAFAAPTPSGGVLGVTEPLLSILTADELEAVLAHELIHLRGPARSVSTTAAMFAAVPGALSMRLGCDSYYSTRFRRLRKPGAADRRNQVFGFWCALPAALLVQLAGSRSDEFDADRGAAELCGGSEQLASALRKIDSLAGRLVSPVNPGLAHLLVVHPFGQSPLSRMFDAHPPMADRIARLAPDSSDQEQISRLL